MGFGAIGFGKVGIVDVGIPMPIGGAGGGGRISSPGIGMKFISGTPLISGDVGATGAFAMAGLLNISFGTVVDATGDELRLSRAS